MGCFVFGFDSDDESVFERTVEFVDRTKIDLPRYAVATPFPRTGLYQRLEAEGRLLHKDWSRYDTAHVVFQPKHLGVEELAEGYAWCYERVFSHASIWRRRPADWRAVAPYLAMSYLYKRSNRFWRLLIKYHLVHAVWRPLVELTRLRHVRFRVDLAARDAVNRPGSSVIAAGV